MRLPSIQTNHHGYALLAADNMIRWAAALGLDEHQSVNHQLIQALTVALVTAGREAISGVVLDQDFGPVAVNAKTMDTGVVWQLEEPSTATDPLSVPKFSTDWNIEHIRNNFGLAKLELYYHPAEPEALAKKQLVAELYDYCLYQQIDFLLKLVIYAPHGQPLSTTEFQTAQLTAIQEFRSTAHILALQSPLEALAAATVTAELDIPWIIFSQDGEKYDLYKEQVRQALEAGAQGFLIGETLWQEAYKLRRKDQGVDEAAITAFLQTTARDRLIELSRILGENLAQPS